MFYIKCYIFISSDKNFPLPSRLKTLPVFTPEEFLSRLQRA